MKIGYCHTVIGRIFGIHPLPVLLALCIVIAALPGNVRGQESPHGKLTFACEDCHSADSWKVMPRPAKFDHRKTKFALKGQHGQVACMDCHTSLTFKFKKSSDQCADCHKDVHDGELGQTCDRCHSPQAWLVPDMIRKHSTTRFSLVGMHATISCQQCHVNEQKHQYVGLRTDCFGCHQADYDATTAPSHRASGLGTDCQSCHAVNAMTWVGSMGIAGSFDHSRTGFPLLGAHATIACVQCHVGNVFQAASTACISCHGQQFTTANAPAHTGFSTDCTTCHTMAAWQPASFDHNKTTFPLTGGHVSVTCQQCHASGVFAGLSTTCYSCHQQQFITANAPPHTGFATDCTTCHNNTAWQPSTFDHSKSTFPLVGAHVTVACVQCHVNNVYVGLATTCYGCHQQQFTTANAPPHTGFATDCTTCHNNTAWQPATFNHNNTTFPLTGAHTTVTCAQCHVNNVYVGLATNCYGCHQTTFVQATTPVPHAGFATDCTTCHNTTAWQPATNFNHASTTFPLVGAHVTVACAQCHANNVYVGLATTCYGCHQQNFTTANAPLHTGFPTDCTMCHNSTAWQPASFDHSKTTFPLTGAHAAVQCAQCHANNVFAGTPTACISCHQTTFTQATTPVAHAGFATDCTTCHNTTAWQPSTFSHASTTFPLTGAHVSVACVQCHANNVYVGLPVTCTGCHQQQFTTANSPPHTGFSSTCTTCHTSTAWVPASFNHSTTAFPLAGAHLSVTCQQCHANNKYVGLPTQCYNCHQQQFTTASAPSHQSFPLDCKTCHGNMSWQPATFDHSKTVFPLTGAHAAVLCAQCHANNVFAGTPTSCISCHSTTFTQATTPVAHAGFATDCTTCHNTTAWQPSTFNHNNTTFPLTGAHPAVACIQCHVNNVYVGLATTCYGCHQGIFTTANAPPHTGFATDCTTCHTTTAWQPATFNHNNTPFPLTGGHTTVTACATCHVNNVYAGLSTACFSCHSPQFTAATTPVPHTGFATDCSTCHTTNPGWAPSTYSHANATPRFPQDNRHTGAACAKCHQTATNYTIACCQSSGCHNSCAGGG